MKFLHNSAALSLAAFLAGTTAIGTSWAHDGDRVSETRDLPTFTKIVVDGSSDVDITAGKAQSVEILTESDHLELVTTEVRGDTLYISMERHRWRNTDVDLNISVQSLTSVAVEGSGDFDIRNVDSDAFDIIIDGSGDVDFSGNTAHMDVEIDGSGDVYMTGDCGAVVVDIDGSGDIDARTLTCESANVIVDGSGDVDVYASNSVEVNISGSGDITVYGDPDTVRPRIRGSGSFEMVDNGR